MWAVLVGCNREPEGKDEGTLVGDLHHQGVVAFVRTLAGERLLESDISAGGTDDAVPDAQSQAYFYDVLPGRSPTEGDAPGFTRPGTVPDVSLDGLAATAITFAPAEVSDRGRTAFEVAFDGVTVAFPPEVVLVDDAVADAWTLSTFRARPATRGALPGSSEGLVNDDEIVQLDLHEAFAIQAAADRRRGSLTPDLPLHVTVAVDPGSPLFDESAAVAAWVYNFADGYWRRSGSLAIDPVAGTIAWDAYALGWWALAISEEPDCTVGEALADGAPAAGVEIRFARDGVLGLDRVTTDEQGRFCAPAGAGTYSAVGVDPELAALFVGAGPAGPPLLLDTFADADRDGAFSGPGGDCDDDDPAVSPDFVDGDASWCGAGL